MLMTENGNTKECLRDLAREIVSEISSLDVDSRQQILGSFVSDLFLFASEQTRKEERRKLQQEGIDAARARGVHMGRKRVDLPDGFEEVVEEWHSGRLTVGKAAERLGVCRRTFTKYAKERVNARSAQLNADGRGPDAKQHSEVDGIAFQQHR